MANINLDPVSSVIDSVSKGVETVAGVFTTNKEKDAERSSEEQMALLKSYQAEFNQRENRNWVDSIADGFNRLVRPFIVCLVLFIFFIAYFSPSHLAQITLAMSSIPDGYWALLSVIIAFYFGGRMQLKSQQFKFNESQVHAVKALIETKNEFRQLEMDDDEPDKVIGDAAGKAPEIDTARSNQVNSIVQTALKFVDTDQNKIELMKQINEMHNESADEIKQRRKHGPRKFRR
ncbi:3TM-type holin [Alteromonadaceae bacterium BrNp21-10]|nr:3TM-type holin [Alteromonadaceae bacterium BrNp21-10]